MITKNNEKERAVWGTCPFFNRDLKPSPPSVLFDLNQDDKRTKKIDRRVVVKMFLCAAFFL